MPTAEESMMSLFVPVHRLGAADEESMIAVVQRQTERKEVWQRIIDYQLIEWGQDPHRFQDEGIAALSPIALTLALKMAKFMGENGQSPPTRVVPIGNGGIAFERQSETSDTLEVLEIRPDQSMEIFVFKGSRLHLRHSL